MTTSKRRRENRWHQRKHNQLPHGKVKSFDELAAGTSFKQTEE